MLLEVYEDKKKDNRAPNIVFGVLFFRNFVGYDIGKGKDTGEYTNGQGTGGHIFGRGMEWSRIICRMLVETFNGFCDDFIAYMYNNENMDMSGTFNLEWSDSRNIIETILPVVWHKRHGAYVCSTPATLFVLFYGIRITVLEY